MSLDSILKQSCDGCGSTMELYGSTCKHLTLCVSCGKSMAEKGSECCACGTPITRLIREYNVRASSSDTNYLIGRFEKGLPDFKKNEKWSLQKAPLGSQFPHALREEYKNKSWLLEEETGQLEYHGKPEGSLPEYYLLVLQGKELVTVPVGCWYTFKKVARREQLTLKEAEEKKKNRRTAYGYQRWMINVAHSGAAAFGKVKNFDGWEGAAGCWRWRKNTLGEDEEANVSDRGEEDEEEKAAIQSRLGLDKKSGEDDEGPRGGDLDVDNMENGDDWEHEEIFSDDDETAGVDPDEQEDLVTGIPASPEIKQEDEDEYETDEEEEGLSKSGKELKKLLRRVSRLNDSNVENDDDDDIMEDHISPVFTPEKETPKKEPVDDSSPFKQTTFVTGNWTSSISKSPKGKRNSGGKEPEARHSAAVKKVKIENEVISVEDVAASSTKSNTPIKGLTTPASSKSGPPLPCGPVSEDEIRSVLLQKTPVTTQDLVDKFNSRLKLKENKDAFAAVLKRMSKIQKTNGVNFVVLRKRLADI